MAGNSKASQSIIWPKFQDADVEIHLSASDTVVLPSALLIAHSDWFKVSLSDRWNRRNANSSLAATLSKHRTYYLVFPAQDELGLLLNDQHSYSDSEGYTSLPSIDVKPQRGTKLLKARYGHALAFRTMLGCVCHAKIPLYKAGETCESVIEQLVLSNVGTHWTALEKEAFDLARAPRLLVFATHIKCARLFKQALASIIGLREYDYKFVLRQLKSNNSLSRLVEQHRDQLLTRIRRMQVDLMSIDCSSALSFGGTRAQAMYAVFIQQTLFYPPPGQRVANCLAMLSHKVAKSAEEVFLAMPYFNTKSLPESARDDTLKELSTMLMRAKYMVRTMTTPGRISFCVGSHWHGTSVYHGIADSELPWVSATEDESAVQATIDQLEAVEDVQDDPDDAEIIDITQDN